MSGVAEPSPGIFTFHLMLFVSLQETGGSAAGATPLCSGPRHSGQFWSADAAWVVSDCRTRQFVIISAGNAPKRIFMFFRFAWLFMNWLYLAKKSPSGN